MSKSFRVRSLVELAPEIHRLLSSDRGVWIGFVREREVIRAEVRVWEDLELDAEVVLRKRYRLYSVQLPPTSASLEAVEGVLQELEHVWRLVEEGDEQHISQLVERTVRLGEALRLIYPGCHYGYSVHVGEEPYPLSFGQGVYVLAVCFDLVHSGEPDSALVDQLAPMIELAWAESREASLKVTLQLGGREPNVEEYREEVKAAVIGAGLDHKALITVKVRLPPPDISREAAGRLLRELLRLALRAALIVRLGSIGGWGEEPRLLTMAYYSQRAKELLSYLYPGKRLWASAGNIGFSAGAILENSERDEVQGSNNSGGLQP